MGKIPRIDNLLDLRVEEFCVSDGHYRDHDQLSRPLDGTDRDDFARNVVCRRNDRYADLVVAAMPSNRPDKEQLHLAPGRL